MSVVCLIFQPLQKLRMLCLMARTYVLDPWGGYDWSSEFCLSLSGTTGMFTNRNRIDIPGRGCS